MSILKTDLTLFENLSDWKYKENFTTVMSEFGELDIHFVDENSSSDECALLLHGNPTWGYLYRNMIDPLKDNGYRVVVPDLPGFGKSDKFSVRYNYSYEGFVDWMSQFIENTDLKNITLFCQDWGGLIGLRLAAKYVDRFEKIVAANTASALPIEIASFRCSNVPAPPDAMMGIETLFDTTFNSSRSKPLLVPSLSILVSKISPAPL